MEGILHGRLAGAVAEAAQLAAYRYPFTAFSSAKHRTRLRTCRPVSGAGRGRAAMAFLTAPASSLWVPITLSPHATWEYLWIGPPSRPRCRTRTSASGAGGRGRPVGGPRCGHRCRAEAYEPLSCTLRYDDWASGGMSSRSILVISSPCCSTVSRDGSPPGNRCSSVNGTCRAVPGPSTCTEASRTPAFSDPEMNASPCLCELGEGRGKQIGVFLADVV